MPAKLYINIEADSAAEARQQMIGLLGDAYKTASPWREVEPDAPEDVAKADAEARQKGENVDGSERRETTEAETTFREFGKAPEGKTRRTKEEIAEDEELAALAEKVGISTEKLEAAVRNAGHAEAKKAIEEIIATKPVDRANISASPEDQQDPENPADAEQDAADEKAEVDAARDPEAPLTIDDLKSAMNEFVEAKGMPAAQKEGPAILESVLGKPPAGENGWRLSLLADATQEQLKAAIAAWKEAANG